MRMRPEKKLKSNGCVGCTPKVEYYQDYKKEENGKLSDIFLVRFKMLFLLGSVVAKRPNFFCAQLLLYIEGNSAFGNLNLIYYANQRNEW